MGGRRGSLPVLLCPVTEETLSTAYLSSRGLTVSGSPVFLGTGVVEGVGYSFGTRVRKEVSVPLP